MKPRIGLGAFFPATIVAMFLGVLIVGRFFIFKTNKGVNFLLLRVCDLSLAVKLFGGVANSY